MFVARRYLSNITLKQPIVLTYISLNPLLHSLDLISVACGRVRKKSIGLHATSSYGQSYLQLFYIFLRTELLHCIIYSDLRDC